ASRRSARLPASHPYRGAHAADRARGRSQCQLHSCAARRRGTAAGEGVPRRYLDGQGLGPGGSSSVANLPATPRDAGWIEGGTILLEFRGAEGNYARLPDLAADLVRLKV